MPYSEEECLDALRDAEKELGESPSIKQYNNLDIYPSADTIIRKLETWNKAKEKANLEKNSQNNKINPPPEDIELPEDKNWQEMTPYERYYYKNRKEEIKRTKRRTKGLKKWFKEYKKQFKCENCGEDHPACIDFHHTEEKESSVTELVSRKNTSKERIKEEIRKCRVLCANCHRKHHAEIGNR